MAVLAFGWMIAVGCPAQDAATPLERAVELRAAGRLDEAIDVLRVESREIKRIDGDESPRLLPVNDLAAEILIDQGNLDAAASLLAKTIAARQAMIDSGRRDQEAGLGASLLTRARLEIAERRFVEAIAAARQAMERLDAATGPTSDGVARARDVLAKAAAALAELVGPGASATLEARDAVATALESLGFFGEAIEQRREIFAGIATGRDVSPETVQAARTRLCRLLATSGRAEEAITLLEQPTADAPASALALADRRLLGDLQIAVDRLIAADATSETILEATGAATGPPTCGAAADRLRRLLIAVRRGPAADLPDWFEPTLKLLARPQPEETAAAIEGLVLAGEILLAREKPAPAADLYARAVALASASKPPSAGLVADLSGRLGRAQLAVGDVKAARKTVEPALAAAERAVGRGDGRVALLRVLLADAVLRDGAPEQAVVLAGECLDRGLPRPDAAWEGMAIGFYDRLPSEEGKETWPERYAAARGRQFGGGHPHVASAWSMFGVARLAAGDWATAARCFSRAESIQRAALGDGHPEVAASLTLLAHAERAAGETGRAAETAARAVAGWEKAAGADHPGTLAAVDVLVASRLQAGQASDVVDLLERLCTTKTPIDPVIQAGHLVRLAELSVSRDQARAAALVKQAFDLSCWDVGPTTSAATRQRLACAAARAARVFAMIGDTAAGQEALRRARELALEAADPRTLLERIEALAAGSP